MKIEKVNDNQIRCTLTKEDLASRRLKVSELAYGTEKARNLFRDMMQQANFEFGFEAEDIPLMIEAIPMNAECIVLIITKVEDPEELDTRFSRFAPSVHEDSDIEDNEAAEDAADEIMNLFRKIQAQGENEALNEAATGDAADTAKPLVRMFRFDTMQQLLSMTSGVNIPFIGHSALYKHVKETYLLLLVSRPESAIEYNKLCNRISEYAAPCGTIPTTVSYLEEHCDCIIPSKALETLAGI